MFIWEFGFFPGYYSFYTDPGIGLYEELEGTGLIFTDSDLSHGWIVWGSHDTIVGTFRRYQFHPRG